MKAQLATPAAGSPALRSAAPAVAPRLASMIGNRATREALTSAHVLTRSPPPSTLRVQLAPSVGGAPSGHQSHPARTSSGEHGDAAIHAAAARGIATPWSALPHAGRIQRSFGRHDISGIQAHAGGAAAASATEIGADAYATGNHVVFGKATDLSTVAHEAAHVIQQRAGVQLKGGVGEQGDTHERHADAVAATVVAGGSAEALLDQYAHDAPHAQTADGAMETQRKVAVGGAVQLRRTEAQKNAYQNTTLDHRFSENHIFKGEVEDKVPKGLHAYQNRTAGEGVQVLATLGNINHVHVIIWTKGAARAERNAKWSSVFPQNMHKGIAAWYINHGPGLVDGTGNNNNRVGTGWGEIRVGYAGNTAYPEGGPDWKIACDGRNGRYTYTHEGVTYTISNP